MDIIEEIYQDMTISGAIVICNSTEDSYELFEYLENNDHAVSMLYNKNNVKSFESLLKFQTHDSSILVCTYADWYSNRQDLEIYASRHNLLMFDRLEEQQQYVIERWVNDAKRRGFFNATHYHIHVIRDASYDCTCDSDNSDSNSNC